MDFLAIGAYGYWRKRAKQVEPQTTTQPLQQHEPEQYPPCTREDCTLKFNHAHV